MLENLKIDARYNGFLFLAESARNPPKLHPHHHRELELNLVVRGSISYVVKGKCFTFPACTLLWMFPSQEHQLVDRTNDAAYYVVVFKPSLIHRSFRTKIYAGLKRSQSQGDGVLHTTLNPEPYDLIRKIMDSLMQGALDADVLNREAGFGVNSDFTFQHADSDGLNAGLHYLLLLCWRAQQTGRVSDAPVALHPVVSRALDVLNQPEWEGDLPTLAKVCSVSEAYLSRIFHRQVGVPLSRYRNSLRLSRFWECYRGPRQKTLTEAVYEAGFGSYAQFYRVYKHAYGRGPSEIP
jgi:AraC-like DNA-binding protein